MKKLKKSVDPEPKRSSSNYLSLTKIREIKSRLNRIKGHLEFVGKMVEERRCVDEILLQLSAVKSAMNRVATLLLEEELQSCVRECLPDTPERIIRLSNAISSFLKQS
jgi:DNA-binding FrmR family transcriptional regulator